jgi:hypothetical protein
LCFGWCGFLRISLVICLAAGAPRGFADTARLSGTIYTTDANQMQTVWPNARVTLKNVATRREVATVANELGQYSFAGILPGDYELAVTLAGFEPVRRRITLHSESPNTVDVQLIVEKPSESISVSANPTGVDTTSSSGGSPILTTNTLKSLIRLNSDFQEALPLLPGVLRGPDGLIRIKGGNANQTNALINNISIGDPFTGQAALRLPAAAVESMRVLSNPFSSEFGGFSSGVVEVTTRGGGRNGNGCLRIPYAFPVDRLPPSWNREPYATPGVFRAAHKRETVHFPIALLRIRHHPHAIAAEPQPYSYRSAGQHANANRLGH